MRVPGKLAPMKGIYNARIIMHGSCKTIFIPKGFCKVVFEDVEGEDMIFYESKSEGGVVIEVVNKDMPCQNTHDKRRESW